LTPLSRHSLLALTAALPLAAALALLPPTYAAALAAAALGLAALVLLPSAAAATIAFAVPFGENLRLPVGGLTLGGVELALTGAIGLWGVRCCRNRDFGVFWHPVWAGLGAMCLAVVASMPGAAALDLAVKELAKWASLVLALALGMSLAREPKAVMVLTLAVLTAGTLEALRGLSQAISGAGPLGFLLGGGYLRSFGSFSQPNPFAAYLATGIMLAAGLLIAHAGRGWRAYLQPLPALALAAGSVMTLGVLASLSRGALLAMVAGLTIMAVTYRPRSLLWAPVLALGGLAIWVLGGFGLLPEFLVTRFATIFDSLALLDPREVHLTGANFAVVQRMAIWEAAGGMFTDNPLLGVGAGNFDRAYPTYALPNWPQAPGHAHNLYLNLLAELGLVGFAAYLVLLATLLVGQLGVALRTAGSATRVANPLVAGYALASVGLVLLLVVHHVFDNLYVHGIGVQIGLLLGLALGAGRAAASVPAMSLPVRQETWAR